MLNDEKLIKQCVEGNSKAQQTLYDRYASMLMGVSYRYARNVTDAEDILQEAFIKIFNSIHLFRHEGSFEGWIKRITVTTALNYMNRNKQIRESLSMDTMAYEVPPQAEEASIKLNGKDLMLDISESTSRSQYARAKALLAMRILEQNKIIVPVNK